MKMVIIDDDPESAEHLKNMLLQMGHEVKVANNPRDICEMIKEKQGCTRKSPCCDLAFIAFTLPGINGLELANLMLMNGCKGAAKNKVILGEYLHQFFSPETLEDLAKQYDFWYLAKPVNKKALENLLEEFVSVTELVSCDKE